MSRTAFDKKKPFAVYGPGRGRDVYIQNGFFFSQSGTRLPKNKDKLLELGYGKILPDGSRALHPRVEAILEMAKVDNYRSKHSAEIERQVAEFEEKLRKQLEDKLARQRAMELEAERAGVDGTKESRDEEYDGAKLPTEEDFLDELNLEDIDLGSLEEFEAEEE